MLSCYLAILLSGYLSSLVLHQRNQRIIQRDQQKDQPARVPQVEAEAEAQVRHDDDHREREPLQHFLCRAALPFFTDRPDEHIVRRDQQEQHPRRMPDAREEPDAEIKDHDHQREREFLQKVMHENTSGAGIEGLRG